MKNSIILFVTLVCVAKQIYSQNPTIDAFKELKTILDKGYEEELRPNAGENKSTEIEISIHALDLEFNDKERKINSDMYFRQKWVDPRLARETEENVIGGKSLAEDIWTPDTFFPTGLTVSIVKYPKPNVFVRVEANGSVLYSQRLQQTSRCYKSEEIYECPIELESYGFSEKDIKYVLKRAKPLGVSDKLYLGEGYRLSNYTIEAKHLELSSGEYSRVQIKLLIEKANMVKEAVQETTEMVNTKDIINESKKIGKFFNNIKFELPSFPKAQNLH